MEIRQLVCAGCAPKKMINQYVSEKKTSALKVCLICECTSLNYIQFFFLVSPGGGMGRYG